MILPGLQLLFWNDQEPCINLLNTLGDLKGTMVEPLYPSLNILGFSWQGSEFHSSPSCCWDMKSLEAWKLLYPLVPTLPVPLKQGHWMTILFKSSVSLLIVPNFVNDLFWEQSSHETPARQSSLFAQNSKHNHILNTLGLFLSLSIHLCPGLFHLRSLCGFFCTHTLFSLYPYQHVSVWLKYLQQPTAILQTKADDSGSVRRGRKRNED